MKKNILSVMLLGAVALGFTACGGGDDEPLEPNNNTAQGQSSSQGGNDQGEESGTDDGGGVDEVLPEITSRIVVNVDADGNADGGHTFEKESDMVFVIDDIVYVVEDQETMNLRVNGLANNVKKSEITFISQLNYDGKEMKVTTIHNRAFFNNHDLVSVTICEGVTLIRKEAFRGCYNLISVSIPSSTTIIGSYAFYMCSKLSSINLHDGLKSIGDLAFSSCNSLESILIPKNLTNLGQAAFSGCLGLTSVTIPGSVPAIGEGSFAGCKNLTFVTICEGVTTIGDRAFSLCTALSSFTIPESVTALGGGAFHDTPWLDSQPEGMVYAGKFAYVYKGTMAEGTSITLKDGTKGVCGGAFATCSGLKSITLPESVAHIGRSAFSGCTGLETFTCYAKKVPKMEKEIFGEDYFKPDLSAATLRVPSESLDAYKRSSVWSGFGTIVGI